MDNYQDTAVHIELEAEIRRRYHHFFDLCRVKIQNMKYTTSIENLNQNISTLEAQQSSKTKSIGNQYQLEYYYDPK